jgi:hypothetical protein
MANEPEKKFSAGAMQATIWKNNGKTKDGQDRAFKTVSVQRCYKDKNDEWQHTNTLNVADIPKAMLVLGKAYEHLALKNQEVEEEIVA